jgi:hypothetical protein
MQIGSRKAAAREARAAERERVDKWITKAMGEWPPITSVPEILATVPPGLFIEPSSRDRQALVMGTALGAHGWSRVPTGGRRPGKSSKAWGRTQDLGSILTTTIERQLRWPIGDN